MQSRALQGTIKIEICNLLGNAFSKFYFADNYIKIGPMVLKI